MPGINDCLVVIFPADWTHIRVAQVVSRFEDIIRKDQTLFKDLSEYLRFIFFLERPDTLEAEEIARYQNRAYDFRDQMNLVCLAELELAEFDIPTQKGP